MDANSIIANWLNEQGYTKEDFNPTVYQEAFELIEDAGPDENEYVQGILDFLVSLAGVG